jgi:hypothetical protein
MKGSYSYIAYGMRRGTWDTNALFYLILLCTTNKSDTDIWVGNCVIICCSTSQIITLFSSLSDTSNGMFLCSITYDIHRERISITMLIVSICNQSRLSMRDRKNNEGAFLVLFMTIQMVLLFLCLRIWSILITF